MIHFMSQLAIRTRAVILLVDGSGVSVMRWQHQTLDACGRFDTNENDLNAFSAFVTEFSNWPFVIVADVIEEDFRTDSIAHVRGSDRAAILERKLSFSFRNTVYRTAKVIGRETEGRRDDKVLFTALTNPELVALWVDRILAAHASIQVVTSAAYVIELLYHALSLKSYDHLLIASLESRTGLRQTYLYKGKVYFSRVSPMNLDDERDFGAALIEQCGQTRKYLERVKLVPYDQHMRVEVIAPAYEDDPALTSTSVDLMEFEYVDSDQLPQKRLVAMAEREIGAIALALAYALKSDKLKNVYAPASVRRYLFMQRGGKAMYVVGMLAMLAALGLGAPRWVATWFSWQDRDLIEQRTQNLIV